jgi:uncharacterized RDD family membrane protein YckC
VSDLVTGEAVVLGVEPAKLPSRMLAKAVDLVLVITLYVIAVIGLALTIAGLDAAAVAAVALTAMVLLLIGLPVLVETVSHGRSPGKAMMGLRVVRSDGGPVRFRHALVRGLLAFFEIMMFFGVPAVIVSLFSAQGRRLGDVFAGTLVVRERIPGGRQSAHAPLVPPPSGALGARLTEVDLSAVPEPLWLAVRQYLGRAGQLYPEISLRMAQQLAADVSARIGEPVPVEVHPAVFLSAALAERQRREWQRAGELPVAGPRGTWPSAAPQGGLPAAPVAPRVPLAPAGPPHMPLPPTRRVGPPPAAPAPAQPAPPAPVTEETPQQPSGGESGFAPPA